MAFLDQLQSLLGGPASAQQANLTSSAGGMTNYGAAPGATPAAAPAVPASTAKVLATLNPQMRAIASGQSTTNNNPSGVTSPMVGGNLATAISGLSAVDPTSSKFGAFAQGLAGGLGAREKALAANAQLGVQQQNSNVDAYSKLSNVDIANREQTLKEAQAQRQLEGMKQLQTLLGGGQPAHPQPSGPAAPTQITPTGATPPATPVASAPPPPAAGPAIAPPSAPQPGAGVQMPPAQDFAPGPSPSAPAPPPTGPAGTPTVAPPIDAAAPPPPSALPVATSDPSGPHLDPNSDPHHLDQRAAQYEQGAILIAGSNPTMAAQLGTAANQLRMRSEKITSAGTGTDINGNQVRLPGADAAESSKAFAAAAGTEAGKNSLAPQVTAAGAKYLPPPPGFKLQPGAPEIPDPPAGASIANTPSALTLDPKTAAVQTAIPAPPKFGGYPNPGIPPGAKLIDPGDAAKEQAKTDATGFANLTGQLPAIDETIQRYQSLANAFKSVQSGSKQENLASVASLAQTYGHPDLANTILGGDPVAAQVAAKEAVNLALQTVKVANPKFAQSEFNKVEEKGTPDIDKLPGTNHQMISEGMGLALRNKAFIADWNKAQNTPDPKTGNVWQSPSAFYNSWSQANPLGGFVQSAQQQIGNFKGMDPPAPAQWKVGVTYVAPLKPNDQQLAAFAKRGIAPGQRFKFNGLDSQTPVEAVN